MPSTRPSCLLLVEDDEIVRETLCLLLQDEGFHVTPACSAIEAIELIRLGLRVTVTVTDVDLGAGPSGSDLADQLHKLLPSMSVIFITGRTGSLLERRLDGREAVLVKPFAGAELSRLVRQVAAKHHT